MRLCFCAVLREGDSQNADFDTHAVSQFEAIRFRVSIYRMVEFGSQNLF